ncbi:MAG: DUF3332 domain-containing protein [Muribaculaceae bacterium]|nr:DUF3332 domain-containing protein [Muribaculaceae bacterium]
MKKTYLTIAVVLALGASLTLQSCLGSFALTNKVLSWNRQVGNKFVNELVFVAFCILPVYELTALADILVINSIEFWSGENPVVAETKVVEGKDAKYLVQSDKTGYTITNLSDQSQYRFNFDASDRSWSIEKDGQEHKFMTFVDDTHVKMLTPDGDFRTVELSQQGVYAYEQMVGAGNFYAAR